MQATTSPDAPARSGAPQPAADPSSLVPSLFRIARRLRRAGAPTQPDVAAVLLLHRLRTDGPRRPSHLAADVGLDLSTVSRHVKSLDEAGLVERTPDPVDGRSCHLSITGAGTTLMIDALARRDAVLQSALAGWAPGDAEQLHLLLARLADDLDRIDEETG